MYIAAVTVSFVVGVSPRSHPHCGSWRLCTVTAQSSARDTWRHCLQLTNANCRLGSCATTATVCETL